MKKVTFYVVKDSDANDPTSFISKLLEQCCREGRSVYVHANNQTEAEALDNNLWTSHYLGFIPHQLISEKEPPSELPSCTIGFEGMTLPLPNSANLLFNLATDIPSVADKYDHILELVLPDPEARKTSRIRYKKYQEMEFHLETKPYDIH